MCSAFFLVIIEYPFPIQIHGDLFVSMVFVDEIFIDIQFITAKHQYKY